VWSDPERWEELKRPESCPICLNGQPRDVIAELEATWATAGPEAPLPGYACVVSKRHVVEPFELPSAELTAFWNEAMIAARALYQLLTPAKMNYEIHGNTMPHLHLHLFPRFAGDPFVGGPVDPRQTSSTRSAEALLKMGTAIATTYKQTKV
jgi:diadenosine tetraphosphate (Ap4A) HIT family hydrolase